MEVRVDNVRIRELISLLASLHLNYEVVDIVLFPDERRVVLEPVEESRVMENPDQVHLEGDELGDII